MSVEGILRAYSHAALKEMARFKGLDHNQKKEPLVQTLAAEIVGKDSVEQSLSQLDAPAREVLDRIVLAGGGATTDFLELSLKKDGLLAPPGTAKNTPSYRYSRAEGNPNETNSSLFEDVVARLTAHGLVFSDAPARGLGSTTISFCPGEYLLIPEEILEHIPRPALALQRIHESSLSRIGEVPSWSLHRDCQLLISYVDDNDVLLTKQGMVPKRIWNAVVQAMSVQEDLKNPQGETGVGRPRFLLRALEQARVVKREEDRLILGPNAESFLKQGREDRLRGVFLSWVEGSWWDEAERIPELRSRSSRHVGHYTPHPGEARRFVADLVAELRPGEWVSYDDFERTIRKVKWDLLFPDSATEDSWGYRYHHQSRAKSIYQALDIYADEEEGWRRIEARFIGGVVVESLYWLGMVALGYRDDKVAAFKLTDLGRALLHNEPLVEEHEPARKIILQPNFQILAFEPVDDHVVFHLGNFAERLKTGPALEFRLTRDSVYRAQQRGLGVQDILSFLGGVVEGPIPQNVQRTLLEWGEQHERIVFRSGVALCQVAAPELMDALMSEPDVARFLARRVSDTAALVARGKDSSGELAKAMLSKGSLSLVTSGDDAAADVKLLTVEKDGRVKLTQRAPSIYVLRRLDRFTEQRQAQRWLTPASVRRAQKDGMGLDEIIIHLKRYLGSAVPQGLLTRVRAWGGFFGRVGLDEVVLLKVADAAALKELLQDPHLSKLITSLVVSEGLAVVRKQDAEVLRSALGELGIEVGGIAKVPH